MNRACRFPAGSRPGTFFLLLLLAATPCCGVDEEPSAPPDSPAAPDRIPEKLEEAAKPADIVPREKILYRRVEMEEVGPDLFEEFDETQLGLLEKLNRADLDHLPRQEVLIVADRWHLDELAYSPLPAQEDWAREYRKALVVDLRIQAFAAYERGRQVRWGPVSSGRQGNETPSGLFHLNWKSRGRYSTVNPEWYLPWYFNFHNRRGISLHVYALPGYPASHACLRLLERDAVWIYEWGEEWTLDERGWDVLQEGTPLLIRERYDFDSPPPWHALPTPTALPAAGSVQ